MIDIFDNFLINFEAVIENLVKNIDIFDNVLINFEARCDFMIIFYSNKIF